MKHLHRGAGRAVQVICGLSSRVDFRGPKGDIQADDRAPQGARARRNEKRDEKRQAQVEWSSIHTRGIARRAPTRAQACRKDDRARGFPVAGYRRHHHTGRQAEPPIRRLRFRPPLFAWGSRRCTSPKERAQTITGRFDNLLSRAGRTRQCTSDPSPRSECAT